MQDTLGEIVEARTTGFVAQCPRERLHTPPLFGSFVRVLPNDAAVPQISTQVEEGDPFADPDESPATGNLQGDIPDDTLYAVVTEAITGSAEPGRRPTAYGLTEDRLRSEQPQIFNLLTTTFAAVHLGYIKQGRIQTLLPPRPPRLHAFVTECSPQEVRALTESQDFLRSLLNAPLSVSADELIAAALRHAHECRNKDFAFLVRAGKQLALLLRDDPERLTALLRKMQP